MPLKLAIGCSNKLFGEGLRDLLKDDKEVQVIGVFGSSSGFDSDLKEILNLDPELILTDYNTDLSAIFNLPEDFFNTSKVRILIIGDRTIRFSDNSQLKDLISRGVVGILPPSADSDLLKKALKAVSTGELWLDRQTLVKILTSMKKNENASLAKREKEIVFHICQGYRNKEIAQKLNISEQTVKSHCNRIYRKLGVSDRLQLALHYHKLYPDNTVKEKNTEL